MTLPPLPPSPLVATMGFDGYHAQDMRSYGQQCAQHALQMAAENVRLGQGPRSSAESSVNCLMSTKEVNCSRHPAAPHGFDRTGSHNAGRYMCTCEGWMPGDAS